MHYSPTLDTDASPEGFSGSEQQSPICESTYESIRTDLVYESSSSKCMDEALHVAVPEIHGPPGNMVISGVCTQDGRLGVFVERVAFFLRGRCVIPRVCSERACGDSSCLGLSSSCNLQSGGEPTQSCCWRYACRWYLEQRVQGEKAILLRVVESGKLDANQEIETQIAQAVGNRIVDINVSAIPTYRERIGTDSHIHEYMPSHSNNAGASSRDFGLRVRLATNAGLKAVEDQMLSAGLLRAVDFPEF